jgi:hypothetical protein
VSLSIAISMACRTFRSSSTGTAWFMPRYITEKGSRWMICMPRFTSGSKLPTVTAS